MTVTRHVVARLRLDRDALVGLRRLGHALRRLPAARPPARRVRARRRRRRGAPADRHRAGAVALHFPWDAVDDLRRAARAHRGARPARRRGQPEPLPGPRLQARLAHPPRRRRPREGRRPPARVRRDRDGARLDRAVAVARGRHELPRPGRPARAPPRGWSSALARGLRRAARRAGAAASSTSSSSPRSTRPTSPTGARRCSPACRLGERARVLVDLGHHAQGTNIEQIVALLADEGRLGGFHFNNRKYADDDLIVGSVNPFELFLIFSELVAADPLPRLTIDQSHNVEPKVEAMVLSVVNLQEAYAKALLVDRDALRAAQEAGDVLARPRAAARRLPHRRPPAVRAARAARGARRGPRRRAARVRLRRARSPPSAMTARPEIDPMSTLTPLDRPGRGPAGPRRRAPGRRARRSSSLASHLLGANRAVSNFGGGNTSAKGTAIDHAGREVAVHVGQGLGQRPRDDGAASTSPALRLDEVLPLIERDAMSDEDMVAYLARCQLDPADAALLDRDAAARVRPGAARPPHASGRDQRPRRHAPTASGSSRECFGDEAAWIPYIRPGFTLVQAGRRGGARRTRT